MSVSELFRAAIESIRAHALRSFLTLLGIIIGVTTVVGVASIISGLNRYVAERIIRLAPDVFVITKFGIIQSREEFLDALKRQDFTPRDYAKLESTLTKIDAIGADVQTRSTAKFRDRRLAGIQVHGCTANYAELVGKDMEAGRWLVEADDRGSQSVAVIGGDVKDELFPRQDPVGRTMTVGGIPFRVIGVAVQEGSTLGNTEDNHVYVPLSTFRKTWGTRNSLDLFIRSSGGVAGVETSIDEVRAVMRALRHTPYKSPDPFGVVTPESIQTLWKQISAGAFILTFLVASVSLGVGGIVIMNIMLVGVVERTREIGVRLAMGATKKDIRRQFLLEAALLAAGGGAAGLALGAGAAYGVRAALEFPVRVTPAILATAFGLAVLVGLVAGYFPARNASNLVVVDALRDEA